MIIFLSEVHFLGFLGVLVINGNLDRISHRFRDMANFSLKNAHFLPFPFNP